MTAAVHGPAAPALRLARGFSCVFWSLPAMAAAHAAALGGLLPAREASALVAASVAPLAVGLWMLRAAGAARPDWRARLGRLGLLALATAGLGPFLAWWTQAPAQGYLAANAAAHFAAAIALLAGINRLAGTAARGLDDAALRREALAGLGMVLWLSVCTVGALAWLFHRAGLLEAGAPTVLARLAALPAEARALFLLPYAMTAYVAWRTKEAAFRRAAGPGA
ncbi:MAG TPA: hypothetical protein P5204_04390 [Kiritimatiellia bacterium]|nr:hypothetical protein [Kiritimatiellia bacterium]